MKQELELAEQIKKVFVKQNLTLGGAESCTAGLVSSLICSISGASSYFRGTIVSYSNDIKTDVLQVKKDTLDSFGAVSSQCAEEMVKGAASLLKADCAYSITGIAGPSGGSKDKPVGTVWFGFYILGKITTVRCFFDGDRDSVRQKASIYALEYLQKLASNVNA